MPLESHLENIVVRLKEFVDFQGLTDRSFEKSIGWSNGFYGKVKSGKTSFSVEKASRIFEEYPQLNIVWLFTGHGKMLTEYPSEGETDASDSPIKKNRILLMFNQLEKSSEIDSSLLMELKAEVVDLMKEHKEQAEKVEKLVELQSKALKKLEELFEK